MKAELNKTQRVEVVDDLSSADISSEGLETLRQVFNEVHNDSLKDLTEDDIQFLMENT